MSKTATIEKYQDKRSEWRWRLRAPNGRIMADSAEGYSTKAGVEQAIRQVIAYVNGGFDTRLKIVTLRDVPNLPKKASRDASGRKESPLKRTDAESRRRP